MSALRLWEPLRQVAVAVVTGRKPALPRLLLQLAVAFCAIVGVYDVLTIILYLSGGPLIGPQRWVLFPDFIVFHAASRAFLEGKLEVIYGLASSLPAPRWSSCGEPSATTSRATKPRRSWPPARCS